MSSVFTSAGTVMAVTASVPATFDQTGYEALTWTDCGEVVDIPEYGPKFNKVTHSPLASRAIVKRKGTVDYGSVQMKLGRVPSDAGQVILQAGVDGSAMDTTHSFKFTLQDGTVQYVTGQIYSYTTTIGTADNIVQATVEIEFDRSITEV